MNELKESQQLELQQINKEASKYYNLEQGVKLMLNSIYGAFGNPYFYFFIIVSAISILKK